MAVQHDHPGRKEGEHAQPPQPRGVVSLGEVAGPAHTCLRRDRAEEADKGHEPGGQQRNQSEGLEIAFEEEDSDGPRRLSHYGAWPRLRPDQGLAVGSADGVAKARSILAGTCRSSTWTSIWVGSSAAHPENATPDVSAPTRACHTVPRDPRRSPIEDCRCDRPMDYRGGR